jgi:mycothiol synthase
MEILTPRSYSGLQDLQKMHSLLVEGRRANNGTYYVHTGDLSWWLFYPPLDFDLWQYISLWDDPQIPGRLLGWSLLSPSWGAFDVYVQPALRSSRAAAALYTYAEAKITELARSRGQEKIFRMWVSQADDVVSQHLLGHGFEKSPEEVVYFTRSLAEPLSLPALDGAAVRGVTGEPEVAARAAAQYGAFESDAPFEKYVQRYQNFMRSPVYDPELDIVAVMPDGRIGSFCIVWTDPVNRVGLFEPVGTHPDFRGRGLAKAVMLEGLRRLQARGMHTAILCTNENNTPAVRLYKSVGFAIVEKHWTFEKKI